MITAGVVEVLTRGEDFDRLRTGAVREFKQTWMQTMVQKQMSRQDAQHLRVAPRAG